MHYKIMSDNPSICIPKVDQNITKNFIYGVLNRHKFGEIKQVKNNTNNIKYFIFKLVLLYFSGI